MLSLHGSLHDKQPWQEVDENSPDPGRHQVSLGRPEVDVENHHGDADTEGVEDHGEEDKLAEERHHQRGGGDDLGQQQEEHGEREENGDGKTDLGKKTVLFYQYFYYFSLVHWFVSSHVVL